MILITSVKTNHTREVGFFNHILILKKLIKNTSTVYINNSSDTQYYLELFSTLQTNNCGNEIGIEIWTAAHIPFSLMKMCNTTKITSFLDITTSMNNNFVQLGKKIIASASSSKKNVMRLFKSLLHTFQACTTTFLT